MCDPISASIVIAGVATAGATVYTANQAADSQKKATQAALAAQKQRDKKLEAERLKLEQDADKSTQGKLVQQAALQQRKRLALSRGRRATLLSGQSSLSNQSTSVEGKTLLGV